MGSSPARRSRAEIMEASRRSPKKKPKKQKNQKSEVSRTILEDRDQNGDLLDLEADKTMSDFLIGEDQIEINLYCVKNLPSNVTVSKMIFEIINSKTDVLYGPKEFLPDLSSPYLSPSYLVSFLIDDKKILGTPGLLMRITLITIDASSLPSPTSKNSQPPPPSPKKVGYFLKPLFKTKGTNAYALTSSFNSYFHSGSFKLPLYISSPPPHHPTQLNYDLQYQCDKYQACELFLTTKHHKANQNHSQDQA